MTGSSQPITEPGHQLPIKQYDDILAEHFYDFSAEQKAISWICFYFDNTDSLQYFTPEINTIFCYI